MLKLAGGGGGSDWKRAPDPASEKKRGGGLVTWHVSREQSMGRCYADVNLRGLLCAYIIHVARGNTEITSAEAEQWGSTAMSNPFVNPSFYCRALLSGFCVNVHAISFIAEPAQPRPRAKLTLLALTSSSSSILPSCMSILQCANRVSPSPSAVEGLNCAMATMVSPSAWVEDTQRATARGKQRTHQRSKRRNLQTRDRRG